MLGAPHIGLDLSSGVILCCAAQRFSDRNQFATALCPFAVGFCTTAAMKGAQHIALVVALQSLWRLAAVGNTHLP